MGSSYADQIYREIEGHCDAVADEPPMGGSSNKFLNGYSKGYAEGKSVRQRILNSLPSTEHQVYVETYLRLYRHFTAIPVCQWDQPSKFLDNLDQWTNFSIPSELAATLEAMIDESRLQAAINRLQESYMAAYSAIGFFTAIEFQGQMKAIRDAKRKSDTSKDTTEEKQRLAEKVREWIRLHQA